MVARPDRAAPAAARRRLTGLAAAALLILTVAGCASTQAVSSAPPTPRPAAVAAPTPPPTPLPGDAVPAAFRPATSWTVTFARPGDIIRETWSVKPTCDQGGCDAALRIRVAGAPKGTEPVEGTLAWRDGKWLYEATSTLPVDCTAGGRTIPSGAIATTSTTLVLATWPIAGTANTIQELRGSRTVALQPAAGSSCAAATVVYPASGRPADR